MEKFLFDQLNKKHFKLTPTKTGWKVEVSTDKINWVIEETNLSLFDVLKFKHKIVMNNYENLLSTIKK